MLTRWIAVVLLLAIGAPACRDDGGPEAAVDLSTIELFTVAADPTGGGWLLVSPDGERYTVHHVAEDGSLEQVLVVPWGYFNLLGLADGRLAIGGFRCDDDCEATVTEVLFIDRDGGVDASEELTRRDGGIDRENTPAARLVGEVDGSLWVLTESGHRRLSADGDVEQELEVEGACVIDGELYELHVNHGEPTGQDPMDVAIPGHPDLYTVSRLSGSELVPADRLELPSNSWGAECAGEELQVNETVRRRHFWDPADGWTIGEWADDPSPAGATAEYTADGHVLVVDAEGTVMVRRRGQWVDTPLRHDLDPELGRQYHAADLSRGVLISCVGPTYPPVLSDLECRSTTAVQD